MTLYRSDVLNRCGSGLTVVPLLSNHSAHCRKRRWATSVFLKACGRVLLTNNSIRGCQIRSLNRTLLNGTNRAGWSANNFAEQKGRSVQTSVQKTIQNAMQETVQCTNRRSFIDVRTYLDIVVGTIDLEKRRADNRNIVVTIISTVRRDRSADPNSLDSFQFNLLELLR